MKTQDSPPASSRLSWKEVVAVMVALAIFIGLICLCEHYGITLHFGFG